MLVLLALIGPALVIGCAATVAFSACPASIPPRLKPPSRSPGRSSANCGRGGGSRGSCARMNPTQVTGLALSLRVWRRGRRRCARLRGPHDNTGRKNRPRRRQLGCCPRRALDPHDPAGGHRHREHRRSHQHRPDRRGHRDLAHSQPLGRTFPRTHRRRTARRRDVDQERGRPVPARDRSGRGAVTHLVPERPLDQCRARPSPRARSSSAVDARPAHKPRSRAPPSPSRSRSPLHACCSTSTGSAT